MPVWIDVMAQTSNQREALMAFYTAVFGWEWDVSGEEMDFYCIASCSGRPVMGLGQAPEGSGVMVTYFSTDDVHASTKKAEEMGATVVMAPMDVMDIGSMAMLIDPTGAVHGLWQPKTFQGFGVVYEPNSPGWFDHTSKEPAKAATYYRDLTGHTLNESENEMRVLMNGDQWFASISHDHAGRDSAQWNPIFVTDSLARVRDLVRSLGATVVLEEMEVPGSAISVFVEPVMQTAITIMAAGHPPE
jgi:predicted enzyme related to lactoylglutathione lyase